MRDSTPRGERKPRERKREAAKRPEFDFDPTGHKGAERLGMWGMYLAVPVLAITLILYLLYFAPNVPERLFSNIIMWAIITAMAGCIGFLQTLAKNYRFKDRYFVDLYTIGHTCLPLLLTLVFHAILNNFWASYAIAQAIHIGWEILEIILKPIWYKAYAESVLNSTGDLIFGAIGSLFAIYFI